ncbi:unnamed protein product, partial [Sphagnum balticum]
GNGRGKERGNGRPRGNDAPRGRCHATPTWRCHAIAIARRTGTCSATARPPAAPEGRRAPPARHPPHHDRDGSDPLVQEDAGGHGGRRAYPTTGGQPEDSQGGQPEDDQGGEGGS